MTFKESEFGVVILKEWMLNPFTGHQVQAVCGPLKLVTAKDGWGFQPRASESNWAIVVGTEQTLTILGCQIRSVFTAGFPMGVVTTHVWGLP